MQDNKTFSNLSMNGVPGTFILGYNKPQHAQKENQVLHSDILRNNPII